MALHLPVLCPACRQQILGGVQCPMCASTYHAECWALAGGCSYVGCPGSGVHVAPARRVRLAGRPQRSPIDAVFGDGGVEEWLTAVRAVLAPIHRMLGGSSRQRRVTLALATAVLAVTITFTVRGAIAPSAHRSTAGGTPAPDPRRLPDAAPPAPPPEQAVYDIRLGMDPAEVRFRTNSGQRPSILVTPAGAAPQSPVAQQGAGEWIAPLDALTPAADLALEISPAPGEPAMHLTARVPPRGSKIVWLEGPRRELPAGVVPESPSFGPTPVVRSLWARGLSGPAWIAESSGRVLLDDGATLQALDPTTGQLVWWTATGGVTARQLAGKILVTAGPGGLWGFDVVSGRRLWAAPLTDVTALAYDGADLVALGRDSVPHLYRLSAADGNLRDVTTLESTPTYLAAGQGLVALAPDRPDGPLDPLLVALDARGERALSYPLPPDERPRVPPLVLDGRLIVAGTKLVTLDPATGTASSRQTLPEPALWLAAGPSHGQITVATAGDEGWLRFFSGVDLAPAGRLREGLIGRVFDMDATRGLAVAGGDDRISLMWLASGRRFPIAVPGRVRQVVLAGDGVVVVAVERLGAAGACDIDALGVIP